MAGPTDPYPGKPANGDTPIDATPVRGRIDTLFQYLQAADLSASAAKSLVEAGMADAINPRLRTSEMFSNFVDSGLLPTLPGVSLSMTIPAGTVYINGNRVVSLGDGGHTYTINQDIYVDISTAGAFAYPAVANGAGAPALTANSVRLVKVVTNGTQVTSITTTGVDSNNVLLYPISPIGAESMQTWTPTFTNFAVGNGTLLAYYRQVGKFVFFHLKVIGGSTTTHTGAIEFTPPVTPFAYTSGVAFPVGMVEAENSGIQNFPGWLSFTNTGKLHPLIGNAASTYLAWADLDTAPFTFGTADSLQCSGWYEAL